MEIFFFRVTHFNGEKNETINCFSCLCLISVDKESAIYHHGIVYSNRDFV
ncbi:hypothetical protein WKT02_07825 [Erysipelotrichaceae bacterium HCN-30851]